MKKVDLTTQFVIYLGIILIGVIGVMNWWFYHDHTNQQKEALESKISAKLDFLESSAGYFLLHFEYELVNELGKEAMLNDRKILYLSIEDENGEKLFEKGSFLNNEIQNYSRKIIQDNKPIGDIKLTVSVRDLISDQQRTFIYSIGLMVLSISLIGGMVYLFYKKKILYEMTRIHNEKEFLQNEHEFLLTIINTASNLVVVLDGNGYITLVNQIFLDTLDEIESSVIDQHIYKFIRFDCEVQPLSSDNTDFKKFSLSLLDNKCKSLLEINKSKVHIDWKFSKISDSNNDVKFLVGTGVDITRQHQKHLELSHLAHHDQLTTLPNRTLFNDRLQEAFKHTKRQPSLFAVLFIDLDNFKPINDNYGHDAGDHVLKMVSQRMVTSVRELDTVARLGGDEFGILLRDIQKRENAHRIANNLLESISSPIAYGGEILSVGASIGVSFNNKKTKDVTELINKADEAMYKAKSSGKNTYYFADETRIVDITRLDTKK